MGGGGNLGPSIYWFGTVRGRGGVALWDSRLLLYGTGGFAYGEVRRAINNFGFVGPAGGAWGWNNWDNNISTGWTVGGGGEYAFGGAWSNWSGKVEYLYTELSRDWTNNGFGFFGVDRRTRFHTVRAGLNYRMNFGGAPSVLARY